MLPIDDELRQAAERVQRVKSGESLSDVYGRYALAISYLADLCTLADAWLTEHGEK